MSIRGCLTFAIALPWLAYWRVISFLMKLART